MYRFWYDNVKPKYGEKAKLCYMDTNIFIAYVETDDIYKDIMEDVEKRLDTSNYELHRPLPKGKNKEVIGLMKDKLCGKIIRFVGVTASSNDDERLNLIDSMENLHIKQAKI